ncbi:MAG: hypothetical protein ACYDAO_05140 [Thermoplasmataceae archaeon]
MITLSNSYREIFVIYPQYLTTNLKNKSSIFPYLIGRKKKFKLKLMRIEFSISRCFSLEKIVIFSEEYNLKKTVIGTNCTFVCPIKKDFNSDLLIDLIYNYDEKIKVGSRFLEFTVYYAVVEKLGIGYKEYHKIF